MNAVDAVRSCMRQYATFSGRARRSEYWRFVALAFAAQVLAFVVDLFIAAAGGTSGGAVGGLVSLALLVPTLAVTWRRLHDTGRSGAWWFLGLVPFGGVVVIVFCCLDSQPVANQYGPSPKPGSYPGYGQPQFVQPQQHGQPRV